jgi:hypothetical protein
MAWFKKKDKIPQLPDAPKLPEIPGSDSSISSQIIPNLPQNQEINSGMGSSGKKEVVLEEAPITMDVNQVGGMIPSIQDYDVPETFTTTKTTIKSYPMQKSSRGEPVFVKIDRYEGAVKDLDEIKKTLKEIDLTLGKVRDVKLREDLEISGWSQEIANIKAKVNSIESRVFNQI